jgi:hypothetical protein
VKGRGGASVVRGGRGAGRGEGRRTRGGAGRGGEGKRKRKRKVLGHSPVRLGLGPADTNEDGDLASDPVGAVEAPTVQHAPAFREADWEVI